jgi:hypothetical protein
MPKGAASIDPADLELPATVSIDITYCLDMA